MLSRSRRDSTNQQRFGKEAQTQEQQSKSQTPTNSTPAQRTAPNIPPGIPPHMYLKSLKLRTTLSKIEQARETQKTVPIDPSRHNAIMGQLQRDVHLMLGEIRHAVSQEELRKEKRDKTISPLRALYNTLKFETVALTESQKTFEEYRRQSFERGEQSSEIFEAWMRAALRHVQDNQTMSQADHLNEQHIVVHEIYAQLMASNTRPTMRTIQLILEHSDAPTFLEHAVNRLFDSLGENAPDSSDQDDTPTSSPSHLRSAPTRSMHSTNSILVNCVNEATSKAMALQLPNLLKHILSSQIVHSIPFNFETSSRILSFFCQQQDFDYALRFVSSMMPKFVPHFMYHSQSQPIFSPQNALLLILNTAAEMGSAEVVETVVMEMLSTFECSIENLPSPINSIVFHAVFKAYLLNDEFDQALQTLSRMKDCGVEMNWRMVLSLINMLFQADLNQQLGEGQVPTKEMRQAASYNVILRFVNVLREYPDLISARIVAILIRACGAADDLALAEQLFDQYKDVEPSEHIYLAMAHALCSTGDEKMIEKGLGYFGTTVENTDTELDQDELNAFCRLFLRSDMEVALEIFLHIYKIYQDKTDMSLASSLLKRAQRVGPHFLEPMENVLEETVREEDWPMFEEVMDSIRRNKQVNRNRYVMSPNQIVYRVEGDLYYGTAPPSGRWAMLEEEDHVSSV